MADPSDSGSPKASVMSQMEDAARELKECNERLDFIEKRLRRRHYVGEEKQRLEKEVKDIKSHLSRHETDLRSLRGENREAMILSVLILGLGCLIYFIYKLLISS